MTEGTGADADRPRRRRRRRATRPQGAPEAATPTTASPARAPVPMPPSSVPPVAAEVTPPKPRRRRATRESSAERGLRDLVGAGRSQLGVSGALRGRDVNRPSDEDLAEADRDVVIIRRNWKPPASG